MFSNNVFKSIFENNVLELNYIFVQNDQYIDLFNRPNKLSVTPLILAISLGRIDCVKKLINIGVNINKKDCLKNTPLHIACMDSKPIIAKLLLDTPNIDMSSLNCFNECPLLASCASNSIDCVKLLLDNNAYPHRRDNKGNNAIHIACEYGNIEIIQLLLNNGVPINCRNSKGKTPLYVASMENHSKCVTFLIENGADVNIPDSDGRTPLQACYHPSIKQIIRKYGGRLR
jgi:ankyrin repeat protein